MNQAFEESLNRLFPYIYNNPQMVPDLAPTFYRNRKLGEVPGAYLNENALRILRDVSREYSVRNEYAVGALENRISYIVGDGFKYVVSSRSGNDANKRMAQSIIDEFIDRTVFHEYEEDSVYRGDRDGEAILQLFHMDDGFCDIRIVEPEFVITPPQFAGDWSYSFGVQTPPLDPQGAPINYWIVQNPFDNEPIPVSGNRIFHIRMNVPKGAKRGLPIWFPTFENLERAEKTLRNFARMAQLVATYAVLRKHQSGADTVSDYTKRLQNSSYVNPAGQTVGVQDVQTGIVDVPRATEYEFPGSNVQVAGYVDTLQAELRAIGARLVMPEYMISGDASNSNYASTMIAESPASRKFLRDQKRYATRFKSIMTNVLAWSVFHRRMPAILDDLEIKVLLPNLNVRKLNEETNRNKILFDNGVITLEEWRERESL